MKRRHKLTEPTEGDQDTAEKERGTQKNGRQRGSHPSEAVGTKLKERKTLFCAVIEEQPKLRIFKAHLLQTKRIGAGVHYEQRRVLCRQSSIPKTCNGPGLDGQLV